MNSSAVPSRQKQRLQVYVPQEIIDLVDREEDVIASTRSKIVEHAIRLALSDSTVCVELTEEEIEKLKLLSKENRRLLSQQAEYMIRLFLNDSTVAVELTEDEMAQLKGLSERKRREPGQQAAVLIVEGLQHENQQ